ncbi:MAG TPA: pyridoxal 5'-phosphate synthase [Solirubrobacteraceae bacterium]|jgi:pyridoxamine 5'-phosphate oxidase|nr:pyridoxal 5'-phosphate synthase [Solirubrobacteraceae bacterium]
MAQSRDEEIREQLRGLRVFDPERPDFDPEAAPDHPAELFRRWLTEAIEAGVQAPHAMTLGTVDEDGRPTTRVLLLKGLDDGRWQFASSRASRKGREIAATPWGAATFYWREQSRQVRLRGRILDAGAEAAARDFLARPVDARVEAFGGQQSEVLDDPEDLAAAADAARRDIEADPELVPEHWTLYHLVPDEVEFWQGDRSRRHVRLRYRFTHGAWTREMLWP